MSHKAKVVVTVGLTILSWALMLAVLVGMELKLTRGTP